MKTLQFNKIVRNKILYIARKYNYKIPMKLIATSKSSNFRALTAIISNQTLDDLLKIVKKNDIGLLDKCNQKNIDFLISCKKDEYIRLYHRNTNIGDASKLIGKDRNTLSVYKTNNHPTYRFISLHSKGKNLVVGADKWNKYIQKHLDFFRECLYRFEEAKVMADWLLSNGYEYKALSEKDRPSYGGLVRICDVRMYASDFSYVHLKRNNDIMKFMKRIQDE